MNHEQIKKVFLETCPKSIDFIALKFIKNKAKHCSVKNSFPHSNSLVTDKGIQVEVLHGGQFSYAATHDISPQGIKSAIKRAILLNEQSLKWNLFPFSLRTRPNFEQAQIKSSSKSLGKETTLGEINDVLSLACGVMKKETAVIHSEGHGSLRNIAGIFNKKKNVLGMMPHPERMIDESLSGEDGSLFIKNLINNIK